LANNKLLYGQLYQMIWTVFFHCQYTEVKLYL